MDIEKEWDMILNVNTSGRDDSESDLKKYPYEPTPYSVLERIALSGYITKSNHLLDMGCGKGRVDFFMSYQTKCHSTGIEFSKRIIARAISNKEKARSGNRVEFVNINASEYVIPDDSDRLYFFNPFCVEILNDVIRNVMDSLNRAKRRILFIFYYPSYEYERYLENSPLRCIDEIDLKDLYEHYDVREKVLIYEL